MNHLAICIPTYNRSEVVQDTLSKELENCQNLGIDIYLYDSSSDGKTKEWAQKAPYKNLYYIELDSSIKLDEKVVRIYQHYGRKHYDYIWLVGDSVIFSNTVFQKVQDAIQKNPTLVF